MQGQKQKPNGSNVAKLYSLLCTTNMIIRPVLLPTPVVFSTNYTIACVMVTTQLLVMEPQKATKWGGGDICFK